MAVVNIGNSWVNPEQVSSITLDFYQRIVLVRMIDGEVHEVSPDYGKSASDKQRELAERLNA